MTDANARILWVEDDLALASLYIVRMEMEGFKVLHCESGEKALQSVHEFNPNLMLLDLMMPILSGFDVLDAVRRMTDIAQPKIIVLSAMSQTEDKEKARKLGADDYLVKSQVTLDDLIHTIRRTLNPSEVASTKPLVNKS